MSRVGSSLRRLASSIDHLRGKFRRGSSRSTVRKPRHLAIDPLEERTLLSLVPADWEDVLVNQPTGAPQDTTRLDTTWEANLVSQAMAADNDGDFVVVWTRYDTVLDPITGQPLLDANGNALTEANIYARYFTDEVQRITLPAGVLANQDPGALARLSLVYGSPGAQKITISAAYEPAAFFQQNIQGVIVLGYLPPGSGGVPQTQTWFYDETQSLDSLAATLQAQIQNFGGLLADATVVALNPHEFVINYGNAAAGQNPKITIEDFNLSGFLPAVQVSTVREPVTIANIPISPDDPALTAQAIEQYFWQTQQAIGIGPIEMPPPDRIPPEGPYTQPQILTTALPLVTVKPVLGLVDSSGQSLDGRVFDITFGGPSSNPNLTSTSGKKDHPLLVISSVVDETGAVLPVPAGSVKTLKQPSPEFRVNPPEPDDPFTFGPDAVDQINPSVAMDADGDFVIVWQSVVPDSQIPGSVSDIFARRFSPIGMVDDPASVRGMMRDANGNWIQGVRTYWDDVQTLVFDVGTGRVTGTFRLKVGASGTPTNVIEFDSVNPAANAMAIEAALVAAGFEGVTVRALNNNNPYQFQVTFSGLSGGVNQPKIVYVPELTPQGQPMLPGTVTVIDTEPDDDPVATGPEDISTFRVNSTTARPQFQPSVGMDEAGNFTIAWATGGQDMSFFNQIFMQRFGRRGERLGTEVQLTVDDTVVYFDPFVAMSNDGYTVVTWSRTTDFEYFTGGTITVGTFASLFAPNGNPVFQGRFQMPGGNGAAAFDSANNLIITADALFDADNIGGSSMGVRAIMYRPDGSVLRPEFRVNSADLAAAGNAFWPLAQLGARPGLDADGDLAIAFEGFGPDVSQNISLFSQQARALLQRLINANTNADLRQYFDPATETIPIFDFNQGTTGDIDSEIEAIMIRAYNRVAKNPSAAQLKQFGRLYAILNSVAGLLRGEASGALYSRFDADPVSGLFTTVFSDSVLNAQRDGHNNRWLLKLDGNATQGDFTIRLYGRPGFEDITIAPVYFPNSGPVNPTQTRDAIETALRAAQRTGTNWPYNFFEGPVTVRLISNAEKIYRDGTPYDLDNVGLFPSIAPNDYLYEITFQGEVHDTQMVMVITRHNMQIGSTATYSPDIGEYMAADRGTVQQFVSLDMQPDGSFVSVWTQQNRYTDGSVANQSIYYRRFIETRDTAGPRVVELMDADGTWLDNQGAVDRPARFVVVTFDEDMMTTGLDSVTNPDNWQLLKNGVPLLGGIKAIYYGMNKSADLAQSDPVKFAGLSRLPTNKFEAVLELDGNGFDPDPGGVTPELPVGVYTVVARAPIAPSGTSPGQSGLRDRMGNPLGSTGFVPAGQDFTRTFVVNQPISAATGDTPVTTTPGGDNARTYPETPGAVAVDADGDYVVVWTATDPATGRDRVFFRLFDADGTPADLPLVDPGTGQPILDGQGNPIVVPDAAPVLDVTPIQSGSPFNGDDQRYASVAADADGDFIITWTNFRDEDGNPANGREQADIYARRFNALGGLKGVTSSGAPVFDPNGSSAAFLVNTYTPNAQKWSSVAADVDGDFVITWSSFGQEGAGGSGYGIYAQRYNALGQKLGSEFRVNTTVAGNQQNSTVAMDATGRFVIVWTSDPTGTNADIVARAFDADGTPTTGEMLINATTAGNQRYGDVAMDLSGDSFVVAWQSAAQDGDGYGVYARRFVRVGPIFGSSTEVQVNTTTAGNQMYPSVAMSHQGDFVVTWSGRGEQTGQRDTSGTGGVYVQRFDVTPLGIVPVGGETRLNNVTNGNQWISSIGSDGEGNYVVVWTGVDPSDINKTQVFGAASVNVLPVQDADGPIVTDVFTAEGLRVRPGEVIQPQGPGLQSLRVVFGENLSTVGEAGGISSVLNPGNWTLLFNGSVLAGGIAGIEFQRNPLTRKYEATVQFDGNGVDVGVVPLLPGQYVLVARDAITDGVNALDGDYDGVPGSAPAAGYEFPFTVLPGGVGDTPVGTPTGLVIDGRTFAESPGAVAVDADGQYVVVWTAFDTVAQRERVYFRLFDADGTPADLLRTDGSGVVRDAAPVLEVTPLAVGSPFNGDDQRYATVASDADGDFVITWTNFRDADGNPANGREEADIYARRFNALGGILGVDALGNVVLDPAGASEPFRVNTFTQGAQKWSDVAMDVDGDFVIVWSSYGQENPQQLGSGYGVYARRYNSFGQPQGPEFLVNVTIAGNQVYPSVAMDAQGRFVVTWTGQTGTTDDIYARAFNADGSPLGGRDTGEILVNSTTAGHQRYSDVAVDLAGDNFVVTWSSANQDGSGYGVYARRYTRGMFLFTPAFLPKTGEMQVNTTTAGNQLYSSVAMDHQGNYIVAWSGRGTQLNQEDIQGFGGVYVQRFARNDTPLVDDDPVGTETRINRVVEGSQWKPSIGSDGQGNFVVAWTGVDPAGSARTTVFTYASAVTHPVADLDGPIVTDVLLLDGTRVLDNDQLDPLDTLEVLFGERISTAGGAAGDSSVLNPANWTLTRNGLEIPGAIRGVAFQYDLATRKYTATVQFDGNGLEPGVPALGPGEYVLTVRSEITDALNALDGDFDGVPGTAAAPGYEFHFSVGGGAPNGEEFLVNEPDGPDHLPDQINATSIATGLGLEQSNSTLAVDNDGDFVAVWMEIDGTTSRILARVFDRNNVPLTGQIEVATASGTQQRDPAVACDADGDFVVVWAQEDLVGPDQKDWNVYARRFRATGVPLGEPFRVNSSTQYDQVNPGVAMDYFGRFVVVWATAGVNYPFFNDIRGQLYDQQGEKVGSEFPVDTPVPGLNTEPGRSQNNPVAAMNRLTGEFAVAWDAVTMQQGTRVVDTMVYVRAYNADGTPKPFGVMQGNVATTIGGDDLRRTARNPRLAVNDNGVMLLAYEGHGLDSPLVGPSYGVHLTTLDPDGFPLPPFTQVNDPMFTGDQVNPALGIDANGNFVVAFNGAGAQPDLLNPLNPNLATLYDNEGVFLQRFNATYPLGQPMISAAGVQQRVNKTEGGIQQFPSLGVTRDGDVVVVWSGRGAGDRQGIFARRYRDAFDTVGPMMSDLVSPQAISIPNGGQVSENIEYLVLTFDEEMSAAADPSQPGWNNSVLNPANYRIRQNGVELTGAIQGIVYGLNMASAVLPGYPQTNKFEVVLQLDGNGTAPGDPHLGEGHYEVIASSRLRDRAGNPLNKTDVNPNGSDTTWTFDILRPAEGETLVNMPPGDQFTQSPQSVAADPDGDYVIVWTSNEAGREGVYAKLYRVTWTDDPILGRQSTKTVVAAIDPATGFPWPNGEIRVTSEPTAEFASVARDGDGDFVVTWAQRDPDALGNKTDWNIYARRYTAAGQPLGEAFRVNSEIRDPGLRYSVQRYPQVAMDVEGDFVITWQSLGQDGSGYGVYAQRYSPAGNPLGGVNEVQMVSFVGRATGTFQLAYLDTDPAGNTIVRVTPVINYTGTAYGVVDAIRAGLEGMGLEVDVQAVSQSDLLVRFVGRSGSKDHPLLMVYTKQLVGDPNADIRIATQIEGRSGEFLVNETTQNNQYAPSIAMDADGDFVITWTADTANGADIFARKFISNRWFRGANLFAQMPRSALDRSPLGPTEAQWRVVSVDDPANHVIPPGSGFDGVVQVNVLGVFNGSGSLILTRRHILTAAHVVTPAGSAVPFPAGTVSVTFRMPSTTGQGVSPVTIGVSQIFVNPAYNPAGPGMGGDLAILVLDQDAPALAQSFDIYRNTDEIGKVWSVYGYGDYGDGNVGAAFLADNQNRTGQNVYEATGDILGRAPDLLVYDFDNGLAANDAFGVLFGMDDLGLGTREVNSAPGDSGGPIFINGLVAAVVTGGETPGVPPDVTAGVDSSFGEFSWDTRVSVYADWIDNAIQANTPEFQVNTIVARDQKWSTVAMDADGDFVITWTSYGQDAPGSSYGYGAGGMNGIFARRFDALGNPLTDPLGFPLPEFQVNAYADNNQQRSSVSMDADGDFVIVWESFQDAPAGGGTPNSYGIYARRYARNSQLGVNPFLGPNGELGGAFRVNTTTDGDQRYPAVAMDHAGDYVVVWSGRGTQPGQSDTQGVFFQRYESIADDAGPIVADVLNVVTLPSGIPTFLPVREASVFSTGVSQFVLSFGEDLDRIGGVNGVNSILNPSNWQIVRDNQVLPAGIADVQFGLSKAYEMGLAATPSLKYEAVVTFDGDATQAGLQPLGAGQYTLRIRDRVRDLFGNALDGNWDGTPGVDFLRKFTIVGVGVPGVEDGGPGEPTTDRDDRVNNVETDFQDDPAIATDADGNYVVVWVHYGQAPDRPTVGNIRGEGNILAQRYSRTGQRLGPQFVVSSFTAGNQIEPDVAMDRFGNFVVVWSGQGQVGQGANAVVDDRGVWARVFNADGIPLGDQFLVNQTTVAVQDQPAVAMDAMGNFVVTWSSNAATLDHYGIWGRRFASDGTPLSNEFLVNATVNPAQVRSDVAMDDSGNFVVVWQSDGQDGAGWGIYGQRFDANGNRVGPEFRVNDYTPADQVAPQVAMDADGDFAVVWSSFYQDGSGYGVYGRRYSRTGQPIGGETRINQQTLYWQYQPAVSMSDDGMVVVTWTAMNQDNVGGRDDGIFARMFNPDGSDYVNPATGMPFGEFRINAIVVGDQNSSAVAMDADGDFTTVWVGPDQDRTGIYQRRVRINPQTTGASAITLSAEYNGRTGWSGGWTIDPAAAGPTSRTIVGTPGDDVFVFQLADTPSTWQVQLNGVFQSVDYRTALLSFDGRGGNDTIRIIGTTGTESVQIQPGGFILSANGYGFTAANIEVIDFDGRGGADTIVLNDTPDNDVFTFTPAVGATPLVASMVGGGYTTNLRNVRSVVVNSSGQAGDTVRLNDNPNQAETFTATPEYATLAGSGFSVRANAFHRVEATSSGGSDMARIFDSAGDDTITADGNSLSLSGTLAGTPFSLVATGFARRHLLATAGGNDHAVLQGTAASGETVSLYPGHAILIGPGYMTRVDGAAVIEAYSGGGNDTAFFYDSPGDDQFVGEPGQATLANTQVPFQNTAYGFRNVVALAIRGGNDTAVLKDNPSASDSFTSQHGVYAELTDRATYRTRVERFESVTAQSRGGVDSARLLDAQGQQVFTADPAAAELSGGGFTARVEGFRFATAYALSGGGDRAELRDSPNDPGSTDTFQAQAGQATLFGNGYMNRAVGFTTVEAFSTAGNDVARLYDTRNVVDTFTAYPAYALLASGAFTTRAANFGNVMALSRSGEHDLANLYDSEGNDFFAASPTSATLTGSVGGKAFANTAVGFAEVVARSTAGGYDEARLRDSALADLIEADANWAKISNLELNFVRKTIGFKKVTAESHNPTDTINDSGVRDFIFSVEKFW